MRLIVFLGRITHQKGCDLIGSAAAGILKGNPYSQVSTLCVTMPGNHCNLESAAATAAAVTPQAQLPLLPALK